MARALLIASLVGAHSAAGLAFPGDLGLMQTWQSQTESKDDSGREFLTHAGVRIYLRAPNGRRTLGGD
eukprot:2760637-Pyramimonas_sp.AAC.1